MKEDNKTKCLHKLINIFEFFLAKMPKERRARKAYKSFIERRPCPNYSILNIGFQITTLRTLRTFEPLRELFLKNDLKVDFCEKGQTVKYEDKYVRKPECKFACINFRDIDTEQ